MVDTCGRKNVSVQTLQQYKAESFQQNITVKASNQKKKNNTKTYQSKLA